VIRRERLRPNAALGNVPAKRFPPRAKILNLNAILGWSVKRNFDAIPVVEWNAEARAKLAQFIFVEFSSAGA